MICIDFSGDYIDVVVSTGSKKKLAIETGMTLKVPHGVLLANGDVDFAELEKFLSPTLAQFAEKKVVMTISYLPTIYSELSLHKERNRQQQKIAVESQVYANISPADYYVDFFSDKDKKDEEGKQVFITYAMPKNIVNGCYEMLERLGKTPLALVPSQLAAERFIQTFFENQTVALAKMGEENITLHLVNPPDNIITRDIVIESSASSLDVLESMGSDSDPITVFVQNIDKLNSYQNIKFPGKQIDKILIYGQSANEELVSSVNRMGAINSELLPKLDGDSSNAASVYTLGAIFALGAQEINFFNNNIRLKTSDKTSTKKANIALIVACVIVLLNVAVAAGITAFNLQSQALVNQRQEELTSPEMLELIERYGNLRIDFVSKLKSENAILGLEQEIVNMGEFSRITLNEIVAQSPEGVTVESVSYSNKTYNLICTGQTEQQASDYVSILTNVGTFDYVGYFGYSDSGTSVSFTVVCELQ